MIRHQEASSSRPPRSRPGCQTGRYCPTSPGSWRRSDPTRARPRRCRARCQCPTRRTRRSCIDLLRVSAIVHGSGHAGGRGGGERTPPAEITAANEKIEDEPDNDPLSEVPTGGRGDLAGRAEDGGEEAVTEEGTRVPPRHQVLNDHTGEPDEPEPIHPAVERAAS